MSDLIIDPEVGLILAEAGIITQETNWVEARKVLTAYIGAEQPIHDDYLSMHAPSLNAIFKNSFELEAEEDAFDEDDQVNPEYFESRLPNVSEIVFIRPVAPDGVKLALLDKDLFNTPVGELTQFLAENGLAASPLKANGYSVDLPLGQLVLTYDCNRDSVHYSDQKARTVSLLLHN